MKTKVLKSNQPESQVLLSKVETLNGAAREVCIEVMKKRGIDIRSIGDITIISQVTAKVHSIPLKKDQLPINQPIAKVSPEKKKESGPVISPVKAKDIELPKGAKRRIVFKKNGIDLMNGSKLLFNQANANRVKPGKLSQRDVVKLITKSRDIEGTIGKIYMNPENRVYIEVKTKEEKPSWVSWNSVLDYQLV